MPLSRAVEQAALLYFSDAMLLVMFAAGAVWFVQHSVERALGRVIIEITKPQLVKFMFFQIGVVLLALVGFKFVVLSGGPSIAVHSILRTGPLTRTFSFVASSLAFVVVCVGACRWVLLIKQKVVLKWFK